MAVTAEIYYLNVTWKTKPCTDSRTHARTTQPLKSLSKTFVLDTVLNCQSFRRLKWTTHRSLTFASSLSSTMCMYASTVSIRAKATAIVRAYTHGDSISEIHDTPQMACSELSRADILKTDVVAVSAGACKLRIYCTTIEMKDYQRRPTVSSTLTAIPSYSCR